MKKCVTCEEIFPESMFSYSKLKSGRVIKRAQCINCQKNSVSYYKSVKKQEIDRIRENNPIYINNKPFTDDEIILIMNMVNDKLLVDEMLEFLSGTTYKKLRNFLSKNKIKPITLKEKYPPKKDDKFFCYNCFKYKNKEDFNKNLRNESGLCDICKNCNEDIKIKKDLEIVHSKFIAEKQNNKLKQNNNKPLRKCLFCKKEFALDKFNYHINQKDLSYTCIYCTKIIKESLKYDK